MKFFPFFHKSESQVIDEAERTFRRNPSIEEVKRHLDRELSHQFSRQFDLIQEATEEISRRTAAGTIDEESAKAAKGQMALQAARSFKVQKAEALKSYEEGARHYGARSWEAAIQAFSLA
ncbi:MAG: hypothetical protein HZA19_00915, partial [Nitrospirae bacterium]|nr:hypothetical protein [Nitrospirota bacterium]